MNSEPPVSNKAKFTRSRDLIYRYVLPHLSESFTGFARDSRALRYVFYTYLKITRAKGIDRSINLGTIPKSGTNYFLQFIANYLLVLYENRDHPVLNREVQKIFTNNRPSIIRGHRKYKKSHPVFSKTPYADLYYGHDIVFLEYVKGMTIILYRNPLDYLVSWYYYRYKKRGSNTTLEECVRDWLPRWIDRYLKIRELQHRPNVLVVAYEDLVSQPEQVFSRILGWLNIPVHRDAMVRALEFSSMDTLRREEIEHGPIERIKRFEGSFIRSGKIGGWKKEIDSALVASISEELRSHGIELSEFILTPPPAADAQQTSTRGNSG